MNIPLESISELLQTISAPARLEILGTVQNRSKSGHNTFTNYEIDYCRVQTKQPGQSG